MRSTGTVPPRSTVTVWQTMINFHVATLTTATQAELKQI